MGRRGSSDPRSSRRVETDRSPVRVKSSGRPICQAVSGLPQTADMTIAHVALGSGPLTDHFRVTKYGLLAEADVSGGITGTCGSITDVNPVGK
ncbi:bsr7977 [Bradyrhizobium diazoefficiens USDA 110]|uniref:Bsr7977 protein n=1 Tax=Bradyrhizobium diazoefficiens (strain JCM 10833 / BCRC 13528 / IAM 13628 / NBRC 14792 / USDA 110) TaxID=224911 RepID=Q89C21_BRADU|nr:hypothetical protein CO678_37455 [Bradyrhizobium diazoefficiens]QBP26704.1 hypothetical protein Bdiaspc4_42185 [Bradyrhizobium diazoefficiens]BAC53242.1 bsr7977 [Bradyrhizobium diazoefficiens USDA 110]